MTERTAWNLSGLSRSFHGVPLDQLPAEIRRALLAAGKVARAQDGTLVALSSELEEEPSVMDYEPEQITGEDIVGAVVELSQRLDALAGGTVPLTGYGDGLTAEEQLALAVADEGGYGTEMRAAMASAAEDGYFYGADPAYDDDDGLVTPWELSNAENELAVQLGASDWDGTFQTDRAQDEADGIAATEVLRYTQLSQNLMQSGPPVPPDYRRSLEPMGAGRDFNAVPLSRTDLDDAVTEMSEFSNSVPEASTTWYDPARDGAGNDGQGRSAIVGERVLALSRLHQKIVLESQRGPAPDLEDVRLAALTHRATGGEIALAQPMGLHESAAMEVERLHRLASGMGLEFAHRPKVRNHLPTGRRVHPNHLRGRDVTEGGSDDRQPRHGGHAYPGVVGGIYDPSGIGAVEQIHKPVLSDRSGRAPSARDPYHAPAGKAQHILGASAGYDDGAEYYDSGDPDMILARHGY